MLSRYYEECYTSRRSSGATSATYPLDLLPPGNQEDIVLGWIKSSGSLPLHKADGPSLSVWQLVVW